MSNVVPIKQQDEFLAMESKPMTLIQQATEVLEFLNKKTGKKFLAKNPKGGRTANADAVICRLNEGYTVQDCKSVIAMKCREWLHDDKMSHCLSPGTLFRRSNFERYIGEIGPEEEA